MDTVTISLIQLCLALTAAIFAYYKFFREGSHRQRIEFDIGIEDLGRHGGQRIIEVKISAANKGRVEQRFEKISLRIRGLKNGQELHSIEGLAPRLFFPEQIERTRVIPEKYQYYFVRPGVTQVFSVTLTIPADWVVMNAHAKFRYLGLNQVHTAEHSFRLE